MGHSMNNMFNLNDHPNIQVICEIENYIAAIIEQAIVDINRNYTIVVVDKNKMTSENTCIVWQTTHTMPIASIVLSNYRQDIYEKEFNKMKEKAEKYIMQRLLDTKVDSIILEGNNE